MIIFYEYSQNWDWIYDRVWDIIYNRNKIFLVDSVLN